MKPTRTNNNYQPIVADCGQWPFHIRDVDTRYDTRTPDAIEESTAADYFGEPIFSLDRRTKPFRLSEM